MLRVLQKWQFIIIFLIVIGVTWWWQGGATANQPQISIATKHYPVYGTTVREIRQSMTKNSPILFQGNKFDGYTRWYVRWRYYYNNVNGVCRIDPQRVFVSTEVTFTMPQWQDGKRSAAVVVERWRNYINALQLHEDGHKDHGISASQETFRTLQRFSIAGNCSAMPNSANATAKGIIARYNQADIDYDRRTEHGRTQGAAFP